MAGTAIINTSTGNGDSFRSKFTGSCTAALLFLHTWGGAGSPSACATYETSVNLLCENRSSCVALNREDRR